MKSRMVKLAVCGLTAGLGLGSFGLSAEAAPIGSKGMERVTVQEKVALAEPFSEELMQKGSGELSDVMRGRVADMPRGELYELVEEKQFRSLVIARVNDYVNVRSLPDESGAVVGKLYNHSVGTYLEEENGWYKIQSGNVTGYVKGEYCVRGAEAVELAKQVRTRVATVTTQTLFVRSEPTTESAVIGMVPQGEELTALEETEGWVKVDVEEGTGWVSDEYVSLRNEFVKAESVREEQKRLAKEEAARRAAREAAAKVQNKGNNSSQGESENTAGGVSGENQTAQSTGREVADYALQFVGNPYVYGGTSLTKGADCSGFVQSVYANFGVKLPRTSSEQRSSGYAVDGLDNAQAGDLVCYSGHIGIYIGDGKIVHASSSKTGIITSRADYRKILAIRRIF